VSGFRHVVLFQWREGTTAEQVRTLEERLNELPGVIPELRAYAVGGDVGLSPGNVDFGVVADFADREAYLVYRDHPTHREVIEECVKPIVAERHAIQYTL